MGMYKYRVYMGVETMNGGFVKAAVSRAVRLRSSLLGLIMSSSMLLLKFFVACYPGGGGGTPRKIG